MAKFNRAAFGDIVNMVKKNADTAKEVMESTSKSATQGAMIKNTVNSVKSNMSGTTTKLLNEVGENTVRAARTEFINNSAKQIRFNTANNVLDRIAYQGNSAVQKSKEFIDNKRINQVIDGHNAQSRQTSIDTIVNNVKERNINRVSQGHETTRQAINNANQTVRNARTQGPEVNYTRSSNNAWQNDTRTTRPIIGFNSETRQMNMPESGPQGSPYLNKNYVDQAKIEHYNDAGNTGSTGYGPRMDRTNSSEGFKESKSQPDKPMPEAKPNPFTNQQQSQRLGNFTNQAKDMFLGGITDTYKGYKDGQGVIDSFINAHKNNDGSINKLRAAGTFMTASAAARVASGGGLYKDRYGNPNLIGVPFI